MPQQQLLKTIDAYKVYRLDAQSRRITKSTLGTYKDRIEPLIKWCEVQDKPYLSDIISTLLRTYLINLQERNLSSYTVNGIARALKAFFNFCVSEELLADSPMRRVSIPKIDKQIFPAFSIDERTLCLEFL